MSVKSFNHQKSSFTPYQSSSQQKQLSLFSRLNLNENQKNSLYPIRNYAERQSSDLFSMRSRKRKGSAQLQLKQSIPGNRTYLNVSLIGKSSLLHNDLFGHQHYQDMGLQDDYDDEKKQFSQKSCPVGPSYNLQEYSSSQKKIRQLQSQIKPRFHKTKNLLRTIGNYLHKFILHNKRNTRMKEAYFEKVIRKKLQRQEIEDNLSLEAFGNIKIDEQQSQNVQSCNRNYQQKEQQKRQVIDVNKEVEQIVIQKQKITSSSQKNLHIAIDNKQKKQIIGKQVNEKIQKFHQWISSLSVINFTDYQRIWTDDHEFTPLYRQICYKYYKQQVYCDVMRSRLTTKQITNKYMHQFIEGLFHPSQFYRFK